MLTIEDIQNSGTGEKFQEGLRLIRESGVLEVLRSMGKVRAVSPETPNYAQVQVTVSNWSLGYNDCLDDIELFNVRYLNRDATPNISPDFQAYDKAVAEKSLTKEEADAIRSGREPEQLERIVLTDELIRQSVK